MSYAETLLPEFDGEMARTRKVLEALPDDKLNWQAHPKSHTIGWNANHVADIPSWLAYALTSDTLDLAPPGGEKREFPALTSREAILDIFDRNVAAARKAISEVKDEDIDRPWTLLQAGQEIFTLPRRALVREFGINHMIHHRAHICVYLRLNDLPVPGLYGPSGDQ